MNSLTIDVNTILSIMKHNLISASLGKIGVFSLALVLMMSDRSIGWAETVSAANLVDGNSRLIASGSSREEEMGIKLYAAKKDAVLTIYAAGSSGSGFLISKDGLVVTNRHVISDENNVIASTVRIKLADGTALTGNVLGVSENEDLALIKIPNQTNLKFLSFAPANSLKIGQAVYAIGSPFGLSGTFTIGHLNNINRSENQLLHDARINSGNSGGPLINSQGQAIGVNTLLYRPGHTMNTAISVSISGERVQAFLTAYKNKKSDFVNPNMASKLAKIIAINPNGQTISATFKANDRVDGRNIYYHQYAIEGKEGNTISIEAIGNKIDPALVLEFVNIENNSVQLIGENNGISGQANRAKISNVLPTDGVYLIRVKTFQPGEVGSYQLKVAID